MFLRAAPADGTPGLPKRALDEPRRHLILLEVPAVRQRQAVHCGTLNALTFGPVLEVC